MKKKEDLKKLQRTIYQWQERLLLSAWRIDVYISEDPCEENEFANAKADTSVDYMDCTLTFYPMFFKQNAKEQEITIVHELCHIFTAELKQKLIWAKNGISIYETEITRMTEQATSLIERVITKAYEPK